jgi:CRP/FNR family transcriptional regulator, nitrogen oxide reductase regulator
LKSTIPKAQDVSPLAHRHISHTTQRFIDGLFNCPGIGIAICDRRLRFENINQALASMNGVPPKDHFGKTIEQVLGVSAMQICPAFERVFERGQAVCNFEIVAKLPRKTSVGRWVGNYFPLLDRHGRVGRVGAVVVEVTNLGQYQALETVGISEAPLVPLDFLSVPLRRPNLPRWLRDAELFRGLDSSSLNRIMKAARRRTRSHKEVFCRQGERSMTLTLLLSGRVKVGATTDTGKEVLLEWMQSGEVFGLGSLVSPPPENVWTIYSDGYSEAFEWDTASIAASSVSCPKFYSNALSIALRWTRQLQERFEELSTKVVEQRLARLVLSLVTGLGVRDAIVNVSDEELAQMAGTNLFTVNKLINAWQRLGYVNKSRRRLVVLDSTSLRAICGAKH